MIARVHGIPRPDDVYVQVKRLPDLFAKYDQDPVAMRAGAPGKVGIMELGFELRDGVTRLVHSYSTGQQTVRRALHIDPALPEMALGLIQSISSGIIQGDRLGIDIVAGPNTQALVMTQSAPKVYKMDTNYATQRVTVRVDSGAYLEYLPDMLIPYEHARFYQEIELDVAEDATMVFCEVVGPGRAARGESFEYDVIFTRVEARSPNGTLRLADSIMLAPELAAPTRSGLLGDRSYLASFYVLTREIDAASLAAVLHECVQGTTRLDGAASRLPGADGVVLRVVGDEWRDVETAIYRAWKVTRKAILGVDVPGTNTFKYGREPAAEWDIAEAVSPTE
jgi:urease accessory protein